MAAALEKVGYEVQTSVDEDAETLSRKIKIFQARLQFTRAGGLGLFYYAGHGFETDGENQVIPRDGSISGTNLEKNIPLSSIVVAAPEGVTPIYVFDACRNSIDRSTNRGFQRFDPPPNTFIGFSTSFGSFATDGIPGFGSQFAVQFELKITQPRANPLSVFSAIQRNFKRTGLAQIPAYTSTVQQDVALNDKLLSRTDKLVKLASAAFDDELSDIALGLAKKAARQGSLDAKLLLTRMYHGDQKSRKSYNYWLKKSAEGGDITSIAIYARDALWSRDRRSAEIILENLSAEGSSDAIATLAVLRILTGCDEPGNSVSNRCAQQAINSLESATEGGNLRALIGLLSAWKRFESREKISFYYRVLYDYAPSPSSSVFLANSLSTFGERMRRPHEDAEALELYADAAARGNLEAQIRLTLHLGIGIGITAQPTARLIYLDNLLRRSDLPAISGIGDLPLFLKAIAAGSAIEPDLYPNGRYQFYDGCGPDVAPKDLSDRTRCAPDAILP